MNSYTDYMCEHVHTGVGAHAMGHRWRSQDNFGESVNFFHHVGPGARTQVVRRGT